MKGKYFIDTNIVVYSFDNENPFKQKAAKKLISEAINQNKGIVSYQVIQEFCNVALNKFKVPLKINDCKEYLNKFLNPICEVFSTMELYNEALDIKYETGYSFYDSLIIASALKAKCSILYSEDLKEGQVIKGLKIENPFISLP
ncbi:MAG: PIN domain-containing protein [bacterium]